MGCDIHLVLEKRQRKTVTCPMTRVIGFDKCTLGETVIEKKKAHKNEKWETCDYTYHRPFYVVRQYPIFARLANVRNYGNYEHIPIRGFPDDADWKTKQLYCCQVVPDDEYNAHVEEDSEYECGHVSESAADRFLREGDSKEYKIENNDYLKQFRFITDPDAHHPNWCTTEELKKIIRETFHNEETGEWEGWWFEDWTALLGMMEGYELGGYYECRAVFWFDN